MKQEMIAFKQTNIANEIVKSYPTTKLELKNRHLWLSPSRLCKLVFLTEMFYMYKTRKPLTEEDYIYYDEMIGTTLGVVTCDMLESNFDMFGHPRVNPYAEKCEIPQDVKRIVKNVIALTEYIGTQDITNLLTLKSIPDNTTITKEKITTFYDAKQLENKLKNLNHNGWQKKLESGAQTLEKYDNILNISDNACEKE